MCISNNGDFSKVFLRQGFVSGVTVIDVESVNEDAINKYVFHLVHSKDFSYQPNQASTLTRVKFA